MARGITVSDPLSASEIADKRNQIRRLIGIADQQIDRARTDIGVSRAALADLEQGLLKGGRD